MRLLNEAADAIGAKDLSEGVYPELLILNQVALLYAYNGKFPESLREAYEDASPLFLSTKVCSDIRDRLGESIDFRQLDEILDMPNIMQPRRTKSISRKINETHPGLIEARILWMYSYYLATGADERSHQMEVLLSIQLGKNVIELGIEKDITELSTRELFDRIFDEKYPERLIQVKEILCTPETILSGDLTLRELYRIADHVYPIPEGTLLIYLEAYELSLPRFFKRIEVMIGQIEEQSERMVKLRALAQSIDAYDVKHPGLLIIEMRALRDQREMVLERLDW
ncbi:MAG TPA: hypothetical protein ENI23_15860 [bacterium]|nr:hypothetical protein [bacterium]